MGCDPINNVVPGLIGDCDPIDFGCIPITDGQPIVDPEPDQIPFAYDPTTGCMWNFICDQGWISTCPGSECDCYEPVVLTGNDNIMSNNKCYQISDSLNSGDRLMDSRTSDLDGVPIGPMPLDWSFTNPTNQVGVLTVNAKMWANRIQPGDGSVPPDIPAQALFMLGRKAEVDLYPLDPTSITTQADGPHNDSNVSYEIHELVVDPRYGFWGMWRGGTCLEGVTCNVDREVAADVDHKFVLAAGETINISAFIAVGYQTAIQAGQIETGWIGADMQYVFEGHNLLP